MPLLFCNFVHTCYTISFKNVMRAHVSIIFTGEGAGVQAGLAEGGLSGELARAARLAARAGLAGGGRAAQRRPGQETARVVVGAQAEKEWLGSISMSSPAGRSGLDK
jgi:hypothetical protein